VDAGALGVGFTGVSAALVGLESSGGVGELGSACVVGRMTTGVAVAGSRYWFVGGGETVELSSFKKAHNPAPPAAHVHAIADKNKQASNMNKIVKGRSGRDCFIVFTDLRLNL
jgi:hypothetical protein